MKSSVSSTTTFGVRGVPEPVMELARQIASLHGNVLISREKHGIHLNFACPLCLHDDGDKELSSKHYALNAEKYFNIGAYAGPQQSAFQARPGMLGAMTQDRREWSGRCMKDERHKLSVEGLLQYTPLQKRCINVSRAGKVHVSDGTDWLVPWHQNATVMIPGGPSDGSVGSMIPLHTAEGRATPGGQYLLGRGYDLDELASMFHASFCVREWAESEERKYRKLPGGFRDSPQGRVCFLGLVYGVPRLWQARIIDTDEHMPDGTVRHWYYNGQTHQWCLVAQTYPGAARPTFMQGFNNPDWPWKPSKYRTSNGGRKSESVLGYDAAREWNRVWRPGKPAVVIVMEGPLDAGRMGRPSVSIMGKFISEDQAVLLSKSFTHAILVPDNDKAGAETLETNRATLARHMRVVVKRAPESVQRNGQVITIKDAGDLTHEEAQHIKQTWLNEF